MEFLHPGYMIAGGALISSPILIHLINRMRFKRIHWAAMEFLLKSQKRNRRRLIIEQLILLLLRILLMLLAGFLVARLVYAGTSAKGATHVVVLDDSFSMGDRDPKGKTTAYREGVKQIATLAEKAGDSQATQFLKVYLASRPDAPVFDGQLGRESKSAVETAIAKGGAQPTLLSVSPLAAIKKGRADLAGTKQGCKMLYFVSDFRDRDWSEGGDAENLAKEVQGAIKEEISVTFLDVAAPFREKASQVVRNHDNLAIVEFAADQRVALEETKVQFTVGIMNYGVTVQQPPPTLRVRVNGEYDKIVSQQLPSLAAGTMTRHSFDLSFPRREKGPAGIASKDTDEEKERKRRLDRYYFHVQADIGDEKDGGGLNQDNCRDLIIEVRRQVPTLLLDGNKKDNRGERSDVDLLTKALGSNREFEIQEVELDKLDKIDLALYPSVILINHAELPEAVVKRLQNYVNEGGTVCYFLGEQVRPAFYNEVLFPAGLFPLKLDKMNDPLATEFPDLEKRREARLEKLKESRPKVLFPNGSHPVVSTISLLYQGPLQGLGVNVYWKAQPRSQWDPDRKQVEDLLVLPNPGSIDVYKGQAQRLLAEALRDTTKLASKEAEVKKYVGPVDAFGGKVRDALLEGSLTKLSQVLDDLLNDPGEKGNPARPKMPDLWSHVDMKDRAKQLLEFRDSVLYGDPLLVSKQSGRGRVVAMMIPPGTLPRKGVDEDKVSWNNWGEGERYLTESYALFMNRLQAYLVSQGGQNLNFNVGQGMELKVPTRLYTQKALWSFTLQPDALPNDAPNKLEEGKKQEVTLKLEDNKLNYLLKFEPQVKPGVLRIYLPLAEGAGGPGAPPAGKGLEEMRAFAFNVDAASESNLKRASKDRLDPSPPGRSTGSGVMIRTPGDAGDYEFADKQPDASESPLLYLFFIIILVAEQAMAVHLSFHLKSNENAPAASAAPAAAA